MSDLTRLNLVDITAYCSRLRRMGHDATGIVDVAERIVQHLFDKLGTGTPNERACVLARLFKTMPFGELDPDQQAAARSFLEERSATPGTTCLVLLASKGDEPEWNSPEGSRGHRAIPLASPEAVRQLPMIAQLIAQMGLSVHSLLSPDLSLLTDGAQRSFNVFHVEDALGSPYVPMQEEFVVPHRIKSVLGFGGLLPDGGLFTIILFVRVTVDEVTAALFKPLAVAAKVSLLPWCEVLGDHDE